MSFGSRQDQIYARRIDRQIYIWKTNYQLKASSEKDTGLHALYWYSGEGAEFRVVVVVVVVVVVIVIVVINP